MSLSPKYTPDPQHPVGRFFKWAGYALVAIGAYAMYLFIGTAADGPLWKLLLGVVLIIVGSPVALAVGSIMHSLGERLTSRRPDQIVPRVLYLRAFSADTNSPVAYGPETLVGTREQQLVRDLEASVGAVIALGRPGEALPTAGAARLYVGDAEWKACVRYHMQACWLAAVYYASGAGANLRWEMQTALTEVAPTRLLFVFASAASWTAFRTHEAELFEQPLPASDDVWYLGFEADGRPVALMKRPPPIPAHVDFPSDKYRPDRRRLNQYLEATKAPHRPDPQPWRSALTGLLPTHRTLLNRTLLRGQPDAHRR